MNRISCSQEGMDRKTWQYAMIIFELSYTRYDREDTGKQICLGISRRAYQAARKVEKGKQKKGRYVTVWGHHTPGMRCREHTVKQICLDKIRNAHHAARKALNGKHEHVR